MAARMLFLTLAIHIFVGTTLAGSASIAALTLGFDTAPALVISGAVGFLAALPLSWYIAKEIQTRVK